MSPLSTWIKNNTLAALVLLGVVVWLGWQVLQEVYYVLKATSAGLFMTLEASYGRLGGLPGYVLLGLGLGAAAGAVAAQHRYRLSRAIALGAALGVLVLSALAYIGSQWLDEALTRPVVAADEPMDSNNAPVPPAPTTIPPPTEPPAAAPDTASQPATGLRLAPEHLALLANWRDSAAAPVAYQLLADTVQLWRQAHGWGFITDRVPPGRQPLARGWVRLASLQPLPPAPAPVAEALPAAAAPSEREEAPTPDSLGATTAPEGAATHPVGQQQLWGQVGGQAVAYTLDWQASGELSGSYAYEQQPALRYRLTGRLDAGGQLHLLEFARGRQLARCELRRQPGGYAGTRYATSGEQEPIRISLFE